jgi:hypothetical protein
VLVAVDEWWRHAVGFAGGIRGGGLFGGGVLRARLTAGEEYGVGVLGAGMHRGGRSGGRSARDDAGVREMPRTCGGCGRCGGSCGCGWALGGRRDVRQFLRRMRPLGAGGGFAAADSRRIRGGCGRCGGSCGCGWALDGRRDVRQVLRRMRPLGAGGGSAAADACVRRIRGGVRGVRPSRAGAVSRAGRSGGSLHCPLNS